MKQIKLTQGAVALVDDADYESLRFMRWHLDKGVSKSYARTRIYAGKSSQLVRMHRFLMNPPVGVLVDHRDRDGLNNQRSNLRICTPAENNRNAVKQINNKSGYKGVSWDKEKRLWTVGVSIKHKRKIIGRYFCLIKAAKAYDEAAIKYYGEFARLNFPATYTKC